MKVQVNLLLMCFKRDSPVSFDSEEHNVGSQGQSPHFKQNSKNQPHFLPAVLSHCSRFLLRAKEKITGLALCACLSRDQ